MLSFLQQTQVEAGVYPGHSGSVLAHLSFSRDTGGPISAQPLSPSLKSGAHGLIQPLFMEGEATQQAAQCWDQSPDLASGSPRTALHCALSSVLSTGLETGPWSRMRQEAQVPVLCSWLRSGSAELRPRPVPVGLHGVLGHEVEPACVSPGPADVRFVWEKNGRELETCVPTQTHVLPNGRTHVLSWLQDAVRESTEYRCSVLSSAGSQTSHVRVTVMRPGKLTPLTQGNHLA